MRSFPCRLFVGSVPCVVVFPAVQQDRIGEVVIIEIVHRSAAVAMPIPMHMEPTITARMAPVARPAASATAPRMIVRVLTVHLLG